MNTVISVRIDKATKDAAQEVAKSAGVSLSTIINAYIEAANCYQKDRVVCT